MIPTQVVMHELTSKDVGKDVELFLRELDPLTKYWMYIHIQCHGKKQKKEGEG